MKTTRWLAAVGGLFLGGMGAALAAAPVGARAEVIFDHPENFADVKDALQPTEKGTAGILKALSDYLMRESRYLVPEGCKLTMVFNDIHLAGDFEPWRGTGWDDVRIIKSIYPPHFKFSYTLADSTGRVIREGREDIMDLGFDFRVPLDRQDPLRYEKAILKDWMRRRVDGSLPKATAQ